MRIGRNTLANWSSLSYTIYRRREVWPERFLIYYQDTIGVTLESSTKSFTLLEYGLLLIVSMLYDALMFPVIGRYAQLIGDLFGL